MDEDTPDTSPDISEFGLVRIKYRYGEGLDFGLPTSNGFLGNMFITQGIKTGRAIPVEEIVNELYYIVNNSPPDDKTEKRRVRLIFMEAIQAYSSSWSSAYSACSSSSSL